MIKRVVREYQIVEEKIKSQSRFLDHLKKGTLPTKALVSYLEDVTYMVGYTHVYCANAERMARASGRAALANFCRSKGIEEQGHSLWGESDLEGFSTRERLPLRGGPSEGCIQLRNLVAEMIEVNPANYLAYLYFTEKVTACMGPEFVELVFNKLGISKDRISVISKHVEVDQDHSGENEEIFGSLLNQDEFEDFLRNLHAISERFIPLLDGHVEG